VIQSEQGADFMTNQENGLQEHKEAAALRKPEEEEHGLHTLDAAPRNTDMLPPPKRPAVQLLRLPFRV